MGFWYATIIYGAVMTNWYKFIDLLAERGFIDNKSALRDWANRAVKAEERGEPFDEPVPFGKQPVTSK